MCGICLIITKGKCCSAELGGDLVELLTNRGPDLSNSIKRFQDKDNVWFLFYGSVLQTRGRNLVQQPISSKNNVLLYNGNVWSGLEGTNDDNDTEHLFHDLEKCSSKQETVGLIANLEGPFAFCLFKRHFHVAERQIWFGRDCFGRKSLTIACHAGQICISSIVGRDFLQFTELPAGYLFCLEIGSQSLEIYKFSNSNESQLDLNVFQNICTLYGINMDIYQQKYIANKNKELFSLNCRIPNVKENCVGATTMEILLSKYRLEVEKFISVLKEAVRQRILLHSGKCLHCQTSENCSHAKVGLLFSGGVDSLILAVCTQLCFSDSLTNGQIDLLNVSFCCDEAVQQGNKIDNSLSSDRKTAVNAYEKLRTVFREADFNLVCIDVNKSELDKWREKRIRHLVKPCSTVLDDSIGCAMWFAARGRGRSFDTRHEYECPSRILLLGTGADEILGGYSRHRTRFGQSGFAGLISELEMELSRISSRNLGRDDRVIADSGRESRLPFLDENFVKFVNALPIELKADLRLDRGLGEKLILRLALCQLGFTELAFTHKKALQFGSGIAKLEARKERADHTCDRLNVV